MLLCLSPRYVKSLGRNVDCGHCRACRLRKTNDWAQRITDHATSINHNVLVITLTYNKANCPADYSLHHEDVQKFIKRARTYIARQDVLPKVTFKFFCGGEYGDKRNRPHYHVIILGLDARYSDLLYRAWGKCDRARWDCAPPRNPHKAYAYCAGYALKKIKPRYNKDYNYEITVDAMGKQHKALKAHCREPEYMRCSQGIGLAYILTYMRMRPNQCTRMLNGVEVLLTRYYRKKLGITSEQCDTFVRRQLSLMRDRIMQHAPDARAYVPPVDVPSEYNYHGAIVNRAYIDRYNAMASALNETLARKQQTFANRKGHTTVLSGAY